MPLQRTRVRVERNDRGRIQVVAGPLIRVPVRSRIADAPVDQVEARIERASQPRRATAGLPVVALPRIVAWLSRRRNRVELPGFFPRSRVVRGDEASNPEL